MREISETVKYKLNQIPSLPGIYKMLNAHGQILYIGKSKCLRKRVRSYFTKEHKWEKIKNMVSLICDIDFIVTDTHLEARLLECNLIKTIGPPFNSQMKNDRRYAYLQVKDYNQNNALSVVHERLENSYGPFRSKHFLISLTSLLKNLYPISFDGKCYQFDFHLFPVTMDKDTFNDNQNTLNNLFSQESKMNLFLSQLEDKMIDAAKNYQYETASKYRDLIKGLEYVKHGINGYKELYNKHLVLKIPTTDGIKLFYVNQGNLLLTKKYKRLSKKSFEVFIKKGREAKIKPNPDLDEKSLIDYRDIIYTEIIRYPKEMVIFI